MLAQHILILERPIKANFINIIKFAIPWSKVNFITKYLLSLVIDKEKIVNFCWELLRNAELT